MAVTGFQEFVRIVGNRDYQESDKTQDGTARMAAKAVHAGWNPYIVLLGSFFVCFLTMGIYFVLFCVYRLREGVIVCIA